MAAAPDFPSLLRKSGLRATEGRIQLLKTLADEKAPITIDELNLKLGNQLNTVTLYRALEALKDARIVERMDLQHGHAHYELLAGRPHHHHVVCRSCGSIEDIEVPHIAKLEEAARRSAKKFSSIDSYSLEFFGVCSECS